MILYGTTVDTAILSAPVILALGTIAFIVGLLDIMIEILLREVGE